MNKNKHKFKTKTATPAIKTIKMTKAIITKTTISNYQNSNNKKKKKTNSTIYPKIFVLKTYQSYKTTDAQHIGSKTGRHFLQY